eukprot:gene6824-8463_t
MYKNDNPNCYHNLGQKAHNSDETEYVKKHLVKFKSTKSSEKRVSNCPVGLKNLGATCYANSVLQMLYMNNDFRIGIIELLLNTSSNNSATTTTTTTPIDNSNDKQPQNTMDTANDNNNKSIIIGDDDHHQQLVEDDLLYKLKILFLDLQFSHRQAIDPTFFMESLQLSNSIHQDIQEFFILLLGLLESHLNKIQHPHPPSLISPSSSQSNDTTTATTTTTTSTTTSTNQKQSPIHHQQNLVKRLFQGSYDYVIVCSHCKYKFKNPSSFNELSLKTDGCDTLEKSIHTFLQKEELTGSNQYFCKNCECKRDCICSIEVSTLPPILNLHLLRYSFDKETTRKKKLSHSVTFPLELNVKKHFKSNVDSSKGIISKNNKPITTLRLSYESDDEDDDEDNQDKVNNNGKQTNSNSKIANETIGDMELQNQLYLLKNEILENSNATMTDVEQQQDEEMTESESESNSEKTEPSIKTPTKKTVEQPIYFGQSVFEIIKKKPKTLEDLEEIAVKGNDLFLETHKDKFWNIISNFNNIVDLTTTTNSNDNNENNKILDYKVDLNDSSTKQKDFIYELSGIIMHKGNLTSGGHYIAQLKDDRSGKWWQFDDDSVTEVDLNHLGKEGKKERRKKKEIEEGTISSSTANMIVYTKKTKPKIDIVDIESYENLPQDLIDTIKNKSNEFESQVKVNQQEFQTRLQEWRDRIKTYHEIEESFEVPEDSTEYYWISTDWISSWIQGESEPIDNSSLQCEHSLLDPTKGVGHMKRISSGVWDLLYSTYKGGPVFSNDSVCLKCLYALCSSTKDKLDIDSIKEVHIKLAKQDKNPKNGYFISKSWFNEWKSEKKEVIDSIPTDKIKCEHDGLNLDKKERISIHPDTWKYLKTLYPNVTQEYPTQDTKECEVCSQENTNFIKESTEKKNNIKLEKKELKELYDLLHSNKKINYLHGEYCVVPSEWVDKWDEYITDKEGFSEQDISVLDTTQILCEEHQMLKYKFSEIQDIQAEFSSSESELKFTLITKSIMDKLKTKYTCKGPIIPFNDGELKFPVCEPCSELQKSIDLEIKLNFTDSSLFVHKISESDDEKDPSYYQVPTRIRGRSYRTEIYPVDNTNTVEHLKLLICTFLDISTFQQRLYINQGECLKDDQKTLREYNITANQIIVCKTYNDITDFLESSSNSEEVGFKGTKLHSN